MKAKYELVERGGYIPTGYKFDPVVLNANLPLEFFEARNALRIAKSVRTSKLRPCPGCNGSHGIVASLG